MSLLHVTRQARSKYRSNRGSCRRKFSALAYVAGDFVLFLRLPPFFSLKKKLHSKIKTEVTF